MKSIVLFVVLLLFGTQVFGQITANGNSGQTTTAYTNGSTNVPIYIWCSPGLSTTAGSLTATPPSGVGPFTFQWYFHNQTTFSWTPYITTSGATSTLTNMPNDAYRVQIYDNSGALVGCYNANVWNMNGAVTANNTPTACNGTNLTGTVAANNFVYYNPPPPESLINASTQITVCFNATHTWVSDLAFYLVGPVSCGSPTVLLSPNPGAIGQGTICNSGDNVNNLCFTTIPSANLNVCNPAPATLSGTYSSYGPASTAINWAPLIGCNAAQGGWRVQIYDCIGSDVGSLTSATISFSNLTSICGAPTTISYSSGAINSAINDNSCSAASASIFQVPVPTNLTTPITLTPTVTYLWTASPTFTIPNASTSLTSSLSGLAVGTTDFTLTATVSSSGTSCTYPATTSFTVSSNIPNFNQIGPICSGATINLPTISTNGYSGSWSPAIDNTTTTLYTFTPNPNECATPTTMTIVVANSAEPTFTPVATICSGETLSPLPTTSNNGINGSWSPALNNTATTTYVFTPTAGQCADSASLTIVVNSTITPDFAQVGPFCSGAAIPALPTTSIDGITGTWSPAIDNTTTTTYTFTPTSSPCAVPVTMTIVVNTNVTPTFTQVTPICSGAALAALPTTSNNGIAGSWSPALDNAVTTLYTFTPDAGLCATNTTMTITVNQNTTPTFTQVAPICSGANLGALPTTSLNGITGSWSPALNNTSTTLYTFTSAAGQCAANATMTITVNQPTTPTFTQVSPICAGATLSALPTTSNNGINGTWSPAINNNATTTYTFSPGAGQCANNATMTITVNPIPTVTSGSYPAVCIDAANVALVGTPGGGTFSGTGVTGSSFDPSAGTSTITYTFTSPQGCSNTSTSTIQVNPLPNIGAGTDQTLCFGTSVTLSGTGGVNYFWDNGVVNGTSFNPGIGSITYTVAGIDANGCANSDQVVVNVLAVPVALLSSDVTSGETPLTVNFTNGSSNGTSYVWNYGNGLGQTTVNLNGTSTVYTIAGTYTVSLTASNGICSDVANLTIIAIQPAPPVVRIPNVFSPNGDGLNDKFFFELENIESIEVLFFNRWGEVVYEMNSLLDAWDGIMNNGAEATEGVYFFTYKFNALNGEVIEGQNFVTIVK